jgi:L-lactate dehydrogenase complex protein LldG
MKVSPAKESILKKIRKALSHPTPLPFPQSEGNQPVFPPLQQNAEVEFAEQFTKLQGKFSYCANMKELAEQLTVLTAARQWTYVYCSEPEIKHQLQKHGYSNFSDTALKDCDCSITGCEALVARTGSIVLSSGQAMGRTAGVYAPVHICIAFSRQVVYDVKDALQLLKSQYGEQLPSLISFATGPSRTADIEKTLVTGVHGPGDVYLFLVEG